MAYDGIEREQAMKLLTDIEIWLFVFKTFGKSCNMIKIRHKCLAQLIPNIFNLYMYIINYNIINKINYIAKAAITFQVFNFDAYIHAYIKHSCLCTYM